MFVNAQLFNGVAVKSPAILSYTWPTFNKYFAGPVVELLLMLQSSLSAGGLEPRCNKQHVLSWVLPGPVRPRFL